MTVTSAIEGFISFRGHQVWYPIVKPDQEDSDKLPLLRYDEVTPTCVETQFTRVFLAKSGYYLKTVHISLI